MCVPTTPDRARPTTGSAAVGTTALLGAGAGAIGVALVTLVTGWGWSGAAASVALVPASAAAAVDLRFRRLPDPLVASSAAVGVFVSVVVRGGSGLAFALLGAACLALPLVVTHLAAPGAIGFGDVKLAGALGVSVGSISPDLGTVVLISLVALATASAIGVVTAVVARRRDVAFGPALVAGSAVALMSADQLGGIPLSWQ